MSQVFEGAGFWNDRFQAEAFAYGEEPNDFLKEHAVLFPSGSSVLSLAEGEGRNAVFLARQGCRVRAVDFSTAGRDKAHLLADRYGVTVDYDLADLTQYELGRERWDGIVSIFCHFAEAQRRTLLASVAKALKPGGYYLMETYNQQQLGRGTGGPGELSHLPSLDELIRQFEGLERVVARDMLRDIKEGPYHRGLSSVCQLIVRKPG